MKIAYVCYNVQERYTAENVKDEDTLLLDFLKQKGLDIHREVWTDKNSNWEDYDLVLLKAPWDYHDHIIDFYNWMDHLKKLAIPMLNPYEIIRWNSDKHYLKDISEEGLSIIPTLFVEKNTSFKIDTFFEKLKTDKLIFKPCISASAKNTIILTPDNYTQQQSVCIDLVKKDAFLVQPFIKEIETEGEWSFIFLDGKYSHNVLKKPRSGDFRVQHCHGGTIHTDAATNAQIETAKKYVDHFAKGCLYARVDGIMVNGEFLLMELELIEPFLFLSYGAISFDNYYNGLINKIAVIKESVF